MLCCLLTMISLFYQSLLHVIIEHTFSMLVHGWGILCWPLSNKMGMKKQIQLVMGCCKLHNFINNHSDNISDNTNIPQPSARDALYSINHGGRVTFFYVGRPISLLGND